MPIVKVSEPHDVRIDRRTRWGNPFVMCDRSDAERARVIAEHKRWLWQQIHLGQVTLEDLSGLHGKRLACHCAPKPCHGDTLLEAAAWAVAQLERPLAARQVTHRGGADEDVN